MAAKRKRKTKKPDAKTIEGRQYRKDIREIFRLVGFAKGVGFADQEILFKGRAGDFDDIFIYENIIVLAEYTVMESKLGDHLNKKKILFDRVLDNSHDFIEYIAEKFDRVREQLGAKYKYDQYNLIVLY